MESPKFTLRLCAALFAGMLTYSWLFPQTIFRDCIRAVFPETQTEEASDILTEEDYISLFRFDRSEYKVTWKFFQND